MVTLSQFSQVCAYSFVVNDAHSVSQTKNPRGSPTNSARDSSVPAQLLTGRAIVLVVVVSSVVLGALMLVSGADVVAVASLLSLDEQLARRLRDRSARMLRRRVLVKVIR
jgi:hypothetical protein